MNDSLHGWYPNLDPAVYYASKAIGSSDLKAAARSLAHYRCADRRDSPALAFGRAYHCAILEPEAFADRYLVGEKFDRRTTAGKLAAAQFEREARGREIISQADMDAITAMAAAARLHPAVQWLSSGPGESEHSGFWIDDATGLPCRMRLDRMRQDNIVTDIKTAKDASPEGFSRAAANYGYHIQEAHYRAGCEALGRPCAAWVFIAQESEPPYAVACYSLTPDAVQLGLEERNRTLAKIAEARATNRWPAYSDDVISLQLPAWKYRAAANPTA
ncbi:MAG: hypothetical protein RLZZ127_1553 [Planctomycetota bacterium]